MIKDDAAIEAQVREAYHAGKKKIDLQLDGKVYTLSITRKNREVHYRAGDEDVRRTESWLHLKPADGSFTPTMQIELKPMGNLRSGI